MEVPDLDVGTLSASQVVPEPRGVTQVLQDGNTPLRVFERKKPQLPPHLCHDLQDTATLESRKEEKERLVPRTFTSHSNSREGPFSPPTSSRTPWSKSRGRGGGRVEGIFGSRREVEVETKESLYRPRVVLSGSLLFARYLFGHV